MSEQMRKEFSAWYLAEVTESYGESVRPQAQKNLDWVREDGTFADPMLRLASLAWQASRESLVIDLPDDGIEDCQKEWPERGAKYEYDTFDTGYLYACMKHEQAIESAGLKVKS